MAGVTEDLGVLKLSRALLRHVHHVELEQALGIVTGLMLECLWDLSLLPVLVVPWAAHGQHEVRSFRHGESPCVCAVA